VAGLTSGGSAAGGGAASSSSSSSGDSSTYSEETTTCPSGTVDLTGGTWTVVDSHQECDETAQFTMVFSYDNGAYTSVEHGNGLNSDCSIYDETDTETHQATDKCITSSEFESKIINDNSDNDYSIIDIFTTDRIEGTWDDRKGKTTATR
ncbi:MAG: hypothetical protein U9N02_09230, partial [Campylobacterota bacterium]|nr:hypothetical protein [Campylobacterota bacterium]